MSVLKIKIENIKKLFKIRKNGNSKNNGNGNGNANSQKQPVKEIPGRKEESKSDIDITELLYSFKDKPMHEVNVTYPVNPDYQFARITYDCDAEELLYIPVEPVLDKTDREIFQRIKGIFERELNKESVDTNRETYIEKKVADIIDL